MIAKRAVYITVFIFSLWLAGCTTPSPQANETVVTAPTPVTVPTAEGNTSPALPPTFTPGSQSIATPTQTPQLAATAVSPTDTPIPFGQTSVQFRIRIPALQLDRRLIGTVSSQITVVDETTGRAVQRGNQAGPLLELRQALPQLVLEPVPEGCESCVYFEYELPLIPVSGSGWLRDPVMLASVENFLTVALGPHFPPDTMLGLRRGVSPYAPANSLALTADGRLWRWLAVDDDIAPPLPPEQVGEILLNTAVSAANAPLADSYIVDCLRLPVETLYLNVTEPRTIQLRCPGLALPTTLVPLYQQLDGWMAPVIAPAAIEQPPTAVSLTTVLDYTRPDTSHLTIEMNGSVTAVSAAGDVVTTTVTLEALAALTRPFLESGVLQPGLTTLQQTDTAVYRLIVRSEQGLLDGSWPTADNRPILQELEQLMADLLESTPATPEASPTP
ncbi:MAG: hypothetical protein Kow0080_10480 [Candidatus Promineifilaceae bacterium]